MQSLQSLAFKFSLKLAQNKTASSDAELETILKQAISSGDESMWLVFLDLLEEKMPEVRAKLNTHYLGSILETLSKHFSCVKYGVQGHHVVTFEPEFLKRVYCIRVDGGEKLIDVNGNILEFNSAGWGNIMFLSGNMPQINGSYIYKIVYHAGDNKYLVDNDENQIYLTPKEIEELFYEHSEHLFSDYLKVESFFTNGLSTKI